jgi:hypothetical protein
MVRLHVHRRPAVPFGQGEDSWAGPPDLACTFGHGDNQDQPRCCAAGPTTSATPVCKHTLSWLRYFVNWRLSRWLRKKTPLEVREAGFSPMRRLEDPGDGSRTAHRPLLLCSAVQGEGFGSPTSATYIKHAHLPRHRALATTTVSMGRGSLSISFEDRQQVVSIP